MAEPHRVAIVVDRHFGPHLADLAKRVHVWICHSPVNRPAVEAIWRARGDREYDLESGATIIDCSADDAVEDVLVDMIEAVDVHHGADSHDPPWSVIEVIGCSASPRVESVFAEFGAQITNLQSGRFEARRAAEAQGAGV